MTEDLELVEQLADEFVERFRRGERPSVKEYTDRYPEHAEIIRDTFEALAMMENLAPDSEDSFRRAGRDGPVVHGNMPLKQLGDYRIIREVGRGGMGIVYEAEQVSLGRHVALKVLPKELLANSKQRQRFQREAKAAAKLHHTNIVPVFGVGEDDGLGYYVMQFIQGLALDEVLEELKRLAAKSGSSSAASRMGGLHVSRRDITAADVARTLMSGTLESLAAEADKGTDEDRTVDVTLVRESATSSPARSVTNAPTGEGRLSDRFALSDSSVTLPGNENSSERTTKRQTYWQSVARIGLQVASALQYAHGQGILHRDIKPANLLLDTRGTVWVTDFGLAKLEDDRNLTQTGDILGTLRYMAPESLKGNVDARSEIYSLGLTLYELLTFRPAFDQTNRTALIDQVMNARFESLDKRNPDIPRDLVTIVHKAIELDPVHRYQSAGELADDLQRYIDDEPIQARRISLLERCGRWARRNRGLAAALSVSAILLLVLNIAGPVFTIRLMEAHRVLQESERKTHEALRTSEFRAAENARLAEENAKLAAAERRIAEEAKAANEREAELRRVAEQREGKMQETLYAVQINLAGQAAEEPAGLRRVQELTDHWEPAELSRDLRNWEWYYLIALCHQERLTVPHYGAVGVAWSPDGSRFASCGKDGIVRIWQAPTGILLATLTGHSDQVASLAWSPDGSRIASGGRDRTVRVWDATTGEPLATMNGHTVFVTSVAWSHDGTRLASAASDSIGEFMVWDVEKRQPVTRVETAVGESTIQWSPNSEMLAVAGAIYDTKTWDQVRSFATGREARWSPDGKWLAVFSGHECLIQASLTGEQRFLLAGHSDLVRTVDWSPDGNFLATGSNDNTVKIWDAHTGQEMATLRGHTDWVLDVKWGPDGTQLGTIGNGTVKVWEIPDPIGQVTDTFDLGSNQVHSIAWNADGTAIAAGGRAGVDVLDAKTGHTRKHIGLDAGATWSQFSPTLDWNSATRTIVAQRGNTVAVLDDRTIEERRVLDSHQSGIRSIAVSPDGSQVAISNWAATADGGRAVIRIYSTATGEEPRVIELHTDAAGSLRWSPDGTRLAAAGWSRCVIADCGSGRPLCSYVGDGLGWIHSIAWNPNGDRVALACLDRTIRILDAAEGTEEVVLSGHTASVRSVCWSPDGKRLASGGEDRMVRIWNVETGAMLLALKGHKAYVNAVAWSPSGFQLASAGSDCTVRIWDAIAGYRRIGAPAMLPALNRRLEENPDDVGDLRLRIRIQETLGDSEATQRDRNRLRRIFESRFEETPNDPAVVRGLAETLLAGHQQQAQWTVLKPIAVKSAGGATLTVLDDDSILASGEDAVGDVYTVTASADMDRIAAIRLEVLPDSSLPNNGPGRHATGNFQLAAFRLFATTGEDDRSMHPVPFNDCWASYAYQAQDVDIAGTISEQQHTVWHVWGRLGEKHVAVFSLEQPSIVARGQALSIELENVKSADPINLGRFRLSVLEDDSFLGKERLRQAIDRSGVTGLPFLAAAYLLADEPEAAVRILSSSLELAAAADSTWLTLLALACHRFDSQQAQEPYAQLMHYLRDHPIPESMAPLIRLAMVEVGGLNSREATSMFAQLALETELERSSAGINENPNSSGNYLHRALLHARLGNWQNSAEDRLRVAELVPDDRMAWLMAAPALILAEDIDGYKAHCRRLIERFGETTKPEVADVVCKSCLLLPDTVDLERLPVQTLADSLTKEDENGSLVFWFRAGYALVCYRAGDFEQAIHWSRRLGPSPLVETVALALVVRSMAQCRTGHVKEARQTLDEATLLIPGELRTLGTEEYDGPLPVPGSVVSHDWLIPEILRREAEKMIRNTEG